MAIYRHVSIVYRKLPCLVAVTPLEPMGLAREFAQAPRADDVALRGGHQVVQAQVDAEVSIAGLADDHHKADRVHRATFRPIDDAGRQAVAT